LYSFLNYVYPVFYFYLIPLLVHLFSIDLFHYILPSFFFSDTFHDFTCLRIYLSLHINLSRVLRLLLILYL
jgi:hypothetical protein